MALSELSATQVQGPGSFKDWDAKFSDQRSVCSGLMGFGYNDSASDLRSLRCSWPLRLSCASFSMSLLHCRCISIAPSLSGAAGLELSMLLATDPHTPDDVSTAASVFVQDCCYQYSLVA